MIGQGGGLGIEALVENRDTFQPLNEYQIQHYPAKNGEPSYTECFLETIDDPVRIKVKKLPTLVSKGTDRQCRCYVDGVYLNYPFLYSGAETLEWESVYEKEGGKYYECSLRFAPLPTTDKLGDVTLDDSVWKNIGKIELTLRKGKCHLGGDMELWVPTLTQGIADEKAKKFAYTVKTGDRTAVANTTRGFCDFTPDGGIEHRFIFKYRPRVALVSAHIIDEPEEERPIPPARRKRSKTSVETLEGESGDGEEEGDVKPNVAKRMRYLEERVRQLNSDVKRLRAGGSSAEDSIDLTQDD
ncbi:hypothetical protein IAU59_000530 [Kwoniella sp. CBS 9459]